MTACAGDEKTDVARKRAGIYCRISKDTETLGLGVKRQERDCRALIESRKWTVADLYVDNDISGFQEKLRPEYERLLSDLKAGVIDAVVVWHQDRLTRRPIELERLIDIVEAAGSPPIVTVQAGDYDLSTPTGRMLARIIGATATGESEHKRARIRAKMDELAAAGKSGGAARTFGYDRPRSPDGTPVPGTAPQIIPEEADRIQEAGQRILSGDSLYSIVQDWTERGVPTVRGAKWSTTALRTILVSPRIAGLRVHRGETVGPAEWAPILDEATWIKVRAVLTDPGRKRTREKRSYLLTGIVDCAECGHPLVATPRRRKLGGGKRGTYRYEQGATQRAYGCVKANGGCGGVFILAEPLETWVVERLHAALDGPGLIEARTRLQDGSVRDQKLLGAITDYERRLVELGRDWADGLLDRRAFHAAQEQIKNRIDDLTTTLVEQTRSTALQPVSDISTEWPTMSISRRRSVIETVMRPAVAATVGPRNRFDPTRISPGWKA